MGISIPPGQRRFMAEDREQLTGHRGPETSAAEDAHVAVRIVLAGVSIAFEGRQAFFDEHVAPLIDAAYHRAGAGAAWPTGSSQTPEPIRGGAFQPSEPQRFQKFAGQVGANAVTPEQRVMVFAFYLWNFERKDEFDLAEIASFFRTVNEEPPADLERLLGELCGSKRFLEARRGTDAMCLTTKGVNYVKNRLLGRM